MSSQRRRSSLWSHACLTVSMSSVMVTLSPTKAAPGFQRQIDVNAEVLAIQHDRRLETGDLTLAHARIDTVELEVRLIGLVTPLSVNCPLST